MASMRRHKTDLNDAHEIAKSQFKSERKETYVQDEYYEQMRVMTRYYDEIEEEIILIRSRMHTSLQLSFPELEGLLTPSSSLFLNIVQLFPQPELLLAHSKTVIKNRLKNNTRINLSSERAERKAIALLEAVEQSYPAIEATDIRCNRVGDYAKRIAKPMEKKEELVKRIVTISEEKKNT